jgi:mono/diheme cytochrome c family protein
VAGLLAGGGYLGYERLRDPATGAPDPAQLALGRTLYDASCAACHGADLEGQANWRQRDAEGLLPAPPHDETGHTWHHPDWQLFEITKRGTAAIVGSDYKTTMGPFGEVLSDDEIWAVLAYIKSRWPANIRARQAEATARAGN